jgi:hypothetical protein
MQNRLQQFYGLNKACLIAITITIVNTDIIQPSLEKELRTIFLPFYEDLPSIRCRTLLGLKQRKQKRGLHEALSRYGPIMEIDYRKIFKRKGRKSLMDKIKQIADSLNPNLVLSEIHGADTLGASEIAEVKKQISKAKWVNWNGDYRDPKTWGNSDFELMAVFDLQLHVAYNAIDELRRQGINSNYWQIGWEPDGVGHEPTRWTPHHDILFLANCYSEARFNLVRTLRQTGFKLGIYGKGWPCFWAKGSTLYDFKKGCQLIRASKIVLGDSQWPDSGFVSNRIFQSFAAGGALVLHQYFKDYEKIGFIDGKHLVIWREIDDLIEKLNYWITSENGYRRKAIADAGQKYCLEHHSFDVRVRELLNILRELEW